MMLIKASHRHYLPLELKMRFRCDVEESNSLISKKKNDNQILHEFYHEQFIGADRWREKCGKINKAVKWSKSVLISSEKSSTHKRTKSFDMIKPWSFMSGFVSGKTSVHWFVHQDVGISPMYVNTFSCLLNYRDWSDGVCSSAVGLMFFCLTYSIILFDWSNVIIWLIQIDCLNAYPLSIEENKWKFVIIRGKYCNTLSAACQCTVFT